MVFHAAKKKAAEHKKFNKGLFANEKLLHQPPTQTLDEPQHRRKKNRQRVAEKKELSVNIVDKLAVREVATTDHVAKMVAAQNELSSQFESLLNYERRVLVALHSDDEDAASTEIHSASAYIGKHPRFFKRYPVNGILSIEDARATLAVLSNGLFLVGERLLNAVANELNAF